MTLYPVNTTASVVAKTEVDRQAMRDFVAAGCPDTFAWPSPYATTVAKPSAGPDMTSALLVGQGLRAHTAWPLPHAVRTCAPHGTTEAHVHQQRLASLESTVAALTTSAAASEAQAAEAKVA